MAGKSDYLENKVLDLLFGNTAYTIPGTYEFALFTTAPTDAGGGTEVTGNAYARATVTNTAGNWTTATGGSKSNAVAITFPTATGTGWGTIVAFGIYDTGGNLLFWGNLTTPRSVLNGDQPRFAIGALVISED